MPSITPEFLKQKAREISYALNRVSFYIKRNELRRRLERLSFEFLENVAVSSEDASDKQGLLNVFKNISALDVLVRIGHSLYEIEPVNANILVREIDSFNSAIRQFGNSAIKGSAEPFSEEPLNLETVFSMPPAVIDNSAIRFRPRVENPRYSRTVSGQFGNSVPLRDAERKSPIQQGNIGATRQENTDLATIDKEEEIVEKAYLSNKDLAGKDSSVKGDDGYLDEELAGESENSENKEGNGNGNSTKTSASGTIRQSAIIEKIKQSGKADLKDLIAQFPNISERTLRYDLQRLCNQGVIEKIGSSGPGTNYIPKNIENLKI